MNESEAKFWIKVYLNSPERMALYGSADDWINYDLAMQHPDAKLLILEAKTEIAMDKLRYAQIIIVFVFAMLFLFSMIVR